ncbi:MAG: fasciclin domain-containing protein [Bacteroidales bacterium]|nr:fasciclin domain-containing protein [Bacteroidales bacterium]
MKMRSNILLCLLALTALSCTTPKEDYYGRSSGVTHEGTVLQALQKGEGYSHFAALVEEVGLSDKLSGKDLITVWAPVDSLYPAVEIEAMTPEQKRLMVENHISLTTIYSRNFRKLNTIATLAGKYLTVRQEGNAYSVTGCPVQVSDNIYENGILHEIGGWVIPKLNAQQWWDELPDEYSIIRDSLNSHIQRTFDRDASEIIGVDSTGRVIYDSVWVVKNPYTNSINLADESARFTLFVPSNEVIDSFFVERTRYFNSLGKPFTSEDSLAVYDWLMGATLHRTLLTFMPEEEFVSVKGNEIRTDYFDVADSVTLSNAKVFLMAKTYVPIKVHMSKMTFNPYWIRKEYLNLGRGIGYSGGTYDVITNNINTSSSKCDNNNLTLFLQFSSASANNAYEFDARPYDEELSKTVTQPLLPGSYTLYCRFVKQGDDCRTDVIDLYQVKAGGVLEPLKKLEGILKGYYDNNDSNPKGGLVTEELIVDEGTYAPLRLKAIIPGAFSSGLDRRICIGECTLIPNDNY